MLVLAMKFSSRTTGGEPPWLCGTKQEVSAEGAGIAFPVQAVSAEGAGIAVSRCVETPTAAPRKERRGDDPEGGECPLKTEQRL